MDYDDYKLTLWEVVEVVIIVVVTSVIFSYVFYDEIKTAILGILAIYPAILTYKKRKVRSIRLKLLSEFRYALDYLTTAVIAGFSIEKAFIESYKSLQDMFGKKSLLCKKWQIIIRKISINEPIEKILKDFAAELHIREISDFADMIVLGKRKGTDLSKVMKNTSSIISEKIMLKEEFVTMTTSKRYEAGIMKIMPMVIIIYLRWGTDNYFENLYHNIFGVIVMTAALICYFLACLLLDKISAFEEV